MVLMQLQLLQNQTYSWYQVFRCVEEKLNQIIPLHLKGGIDNKEPCLCIHVAMKQFKDIQRHSLQLCNGMYKITSKIFTKLTWAP